MATYITYTCPSCGRILRSGMNLTSYGPPLVKCMQCETMVETGMHKSPTFSDKFGAVIPFVGIIFGVGITLLLTDIEITDFEMNWVFGLIVLGIGGYSLYISLYNLNLIWQYERQLQDSDSEEVPYW